MTRIKSSSPEGVRISDVDVDAPTFERGTESTLGDLALAFDKVTGSNGEAPVNHDGTDGMGALLGIPYINQQIGRSIFIDGGGSAKDGGGGATYLCACPLYLPAGETEVVADVLSDFDFATPGLSPVAYMRNVSDFSVAGDDERVAFTENGFANDDDGVAGVMYRARIKGLTGGQLYLFFIEVQTLAAVVDGITFRLHSLCVHPGRARRRGLRTATPAARGDTSPIPVTAATALEGLAHVNFDDDLLDDDNDALNGYLLVNGNRNANGLWEYVSGWPAGSNAAYVQEDQDSGGAADDVNPNRSRFFAHTLSQYGTEAEVDFPLWAECFGAFKVAGGLVTNAPAIGSSPTSGMLNWFAPWPTDEAQQIIRRLEVMNPDFRNGGNSRLRWAILAGFDSGTIGNWSGAVSTDTAGSVAVAFAVVPNAPNGSGAEKLALCQDDVQNFAPDAFETFNVITTKTSGSQAAVDELVILGVCFWFEAP